ncbi:MAG: spondin domain-containing protein [Acidobacteria bacterium]|nr:spondin domain-containing protein [Acidobacteriota bacterium]
MRTTPSLASLVVLCAAGWAGCGDGGSPPVSPTEPAVPPVATESCAASATYGVTFRATWNETSHGSSPPFPSSAHFSRVVGATHVEDVSFWSSGAIATEGIESMAETGAVTAFCNEVQGEAARGRAGGCIRGLEASFPSPGTVTLAFDVDEDRPFLTLVSMIAPSPDWFVGVDGIALQQAGCWTPRIEMDLAGYDAGTDRGTTFTAPDADVTPHEPIGPIDDLPAGVREVPFATLVLEREDGG